MNTWPHAPSKAVTAPGIYMITAGTFHKVHRFNDPVRLQLLHEMLLACLEDEGWTPFAWAVFSNHYHVLAKSPDKDKAVQPLTGKIHTLSATRLNELDGTPGRQVRYRCWDSLITFEKSVMARLSYVHHNAIKHGLVTRAEDYPYCSATWFRQHGDRPFVESAISFKYDNLKVYDDF